MQHYVVNYDKEEANASSFFAEIYRKGVSIFTFTNEAQFLKQARF